jgi:hypothetical protein
MWQLEGLVVVALLQVPVSGPMERILTTSLSDSSILIGSLNPVREGEIRTKERSLESGVTRCFGCSLGWPKADNVSI